MNPYTVQISDHPSRGAHRVSLRGRGSHDAWQTACRLLEIHIDDMRWRTAWDPMTSLEMAGWEPMDGGAVCYLVGSLDNWRALRAVPMPIPTFDHVARALDAAGGVLNEVEIASRTLSSPDYDTITTGSWPWRVSGELFLASRVRPSGTVTPHQLDGLGHILSAAARLESWALADFSPIHVRVDEDTIVLPSPVETGTILEHVYVWWLLWWVEIDCVHLDNR